MRARLRQLDRHISVVSGILLALATMGCGREVARTADAAATVAPPPAAAPAAPHEHPAPHGGTLIELGDEFAHVEFVLDRGAGLLTAYIVDGEAEQPIRIADHTIGILVSDLPAISGKPVELAAVASALTGETVGDTSQFAIQLPAFRTTAPLSGSIFEVTVRGRQFRDVRFRLGPS